jgi:hypothetical protein
LRVMPQHQSEPYRLQNDIVELVLDEDANWTPAALIDKRFGQTIAGPIRTGYYLENEEYIDEAEVGGPGDVTEAQVERRDEEGAEVLTVRLQTRQFDISRQYTLRPDDPILYCAYELTPRPGLKERGGRLDMPLITFGDGLESPMMTGNDVSQFPVDLGGGLLRTAWRLARDPSGQSGLGLLLPESKRFLRADVLANGFALRSQLFDCFWKDSDSLWRVDWSDDPSENLAGRDHLEFCLFPYRSADWQPEPLELFAGSTYGADQNTWVGPVIPVERTPSVWPSGLTAEKPVSLHVPVGGEVRLLVLTRDGRLAQSVALDSPHDARVQVSLVAEAAGGREVAIRYPEGEPGTHIECTLVVTFDGSRVSIPLKIRPVGGVIPSHANDGVVVPARDIARSGNYAQRYVSGEWWWREDVPSLGEPGALSIEGWNCEEPVILDAPVRGRHAVIAGVGAAGGALAHVPVSNFLRGVTVTGYEANQGSACWEDSGVCQTSRPIGSVEPVFDSPFLLRDNEVHLGTADLSGQKVALAPLKRFPEIFSLQYVRFVPVEGEAKCASPAKADFGLGGLCDVFDIAHTYGESKDGETYRASVRQHAEAGFDRIAWQSTALLAKFPSRSIRYYGLEAVGHQHYIPSCRSLGGDLSRGINPLALAVEEARAQDVALYGWVRPTFASDALPHASADWRCVDWRGRRRDRLSMAYQPVRDAYRQTLVEIADYGVDGILYDTMRHPPLVHYCEPLVRGYRERFDEGPPVMSRADGRNLERHPWLEFRAEVITQLFRDIRRDLDAAGHGRVALAARIEASGILYDGCDIFTWIDEGLVRDFMLHMRMEESPCAPWVQACQFDVEAYLHALAHEVEGLPVRTRAALFDGDVTIGLCLDCRDTTYSSPQDLVRIAKWGRAHGFQRMELHESNLAVMQPGKPAALRQGICP